MVVLIKQHNSERHPVIPGTLHRAAAGIPTLRDRGRTPSRTPSRQTFRVASPSPSRYAFNQSLLTSLFARNLQLDLASSSTKPPPGFVLFPWKTVSVLLRANALHSHPNTNLNPLSDRLVIVLVDTSFRLEARRSPTIYQARDEAYAECNKVDDIRALDRVAQAHHTWRPKTCFGAGPCTLADVARDFKKRSWSSSSGHATTDNSKAAMLTCTATTTMRKPPSRKRQCVRRATPL
ncbi:hypothetical protein ColKHC_06606 [Colletotrichum higginsianum]|nr:hypothetical protein ColKHC_06606 [Colletotrichum higginsianum]